MCRLALGSSNQPIATVPRELAYKGRCLKEDFETVVAADPRLQPLGPDEMVSVLLSVEGIASQGVFATRLAVHRGMGKESNKVTAIVVSGQAWHHPNVRRILLDVKSKSRRKGARCILVPEWSVCASTRSATAKIISDSRYVASSATQRLSLLAHVAQSGWSTLEDCASLICHPDSVGAVLAMVATGALKIDRTRSITPHSRIDVPGV